MDTLILTRLFRLTHLTVMRNLNEITDEEAEKPPEQGGNSINFILGHIVVTRESVLEMLSISGICPEGIIGIYARGSSDSGSTLLPLADLVRLYNESQELILGRFASLSSEDLEKEQGDSTLLEKLLEFYFHETYHAGQLGILRRFAGRPGALS